MAVGAVAAEEEFGEAFVTRQSSGTPFATMALTAPPQSLSSSTTTTLLAIARRGLLTLRPTPALRWKYFEAFERSALLVVTLLAFSSEQFGCCVLPRCCRCPPFFSGDRLLPAAKRMDVMAPWGVEA